MTLARWCFVFCFFNIAYSVPHDKFALSLINGNVSETNPFRNKCLQGILKNICPCGTFLTVFNLNKHPTTFIPLLSRDSCYSFFVRNFRVCTTRIWSEHYIVTVRDIENFAFNVYCLTRDIFWHPTGKFIFLIDRAVNETSFSKLFDILVKYKIYNAIVVKDVCNVTTLYTYDAFYNGTCGRSVGKILKIGACDTIEDLSMDTLFPNNIGDELLNCSVVVAAGEDIPNFIFNTSNYKWDGQPILGFEQLIIETAAKYENFNVSYIYLNGIESFGVIYPNGTATGTLGYLQQHKANLAAGGFMLMQNRAKVFDYVLGYHYPTLSIFTRSSFGYRWKYVYREFGAVSWLLIVLTSAAVIVTVLLIDTIWFKMGFKKDDRIYLSFVFLGQFFTDYSHCLNKKKFRFIMIFWLWFTYFISNFYTTALYSMVTGNVRPKQFKDLDYMQSNGLEPCIATPVREFFKFAYNQTFPEGSHMKECDISKINMDIVSSKSNFYTIERNYVYDMRNCKYLDNEGSSLLESWPYPSNSITVLFFQKGSALVNIIQKYSSYISGSGLLQKQLSDISYGNRLLCQRKLKVFYKITIGDLRIPFIIIVIGWLLSAITFGIELSIHKHKRTTISINTR